MSTTSNGAVVITRIHPTGTGSGVTSHNSPGRTASSMLGRFRAWQPKALGAVEIMVGLVILLLGIVLASSPHPDNIGVESGIFVWGSIIYVIAGSLTVAADSHLNKCLVKGSLGVNIVAIITALTGITLFSIDAAGILLVISCNLNNPDDQYHNPTTSPSDPQNDMSTSKLQTNSNCQEKWSKPNGISGVLAVLSLLEFILSICISSIACQAVCQSHPTSEVIVIGNQIPVPQCDHVTPSSAPFPPNYETVEYVKNVDGAGMGTEFQLYDPPPEYIDVLPFKLN
ncbi:hypothetical protein DPEC_G00275130 [Dallia pectoralis]|uniref:Uncharacterized protein n=1 Tax=Dallia pectoralis TaxID=75939 RepID=A0ACC2FL24_DALPE|nr:hypothetical protein DPEC_G00275130 [Dallia pectoralis]